MTQSNTTVLMIFVVMILMGIGIGMLWDILKTFSDKCTVKSIVSIFDGIFWIIITVALFLILMYVNDGALRFFEFLGAFLGIVLYFSAISRLFRKFFSIFVNIITKICIILLTPVKFFLKMLYKIFYILFILPSIYLLDKLKKLFDFVKYEIKQAVFIAKKI